MLRFYVIIYIQAMMNQLQKKLEAQRRRNFGDANQIQQVKKQEKPIISKTENNAFLERKKNLQMFFAKQQGGSDTKQEKSDIVPIQKEEIKGDRDNFNNARKILQQQMANKSGGSSQTVSNIITPSLGGLPPPPPPPPSSIQISTLPPPPPPPPMKNISTLLPPPPPPPPPPSPSFDTSTNNSQTLKPQTMPTNKTTSNIIPSSLPIKNENKVQSNLLPPPPPPPSSFNTSTNNSQTLKPQTMPTNKTTSNIIPSSLPIKNENKVQSNLLPPPPPPPPPPQQQISQHTTKIEHTISSNNKKQQTHHPTQQISKNPTFTDQQYQYVIHKEPSSIIALQQNKKTIPNSTIVQNYHNSSLKPLQPPSQITQNNAKPRKKIFEMKKYQPFTTPFFGKDIAGFIKRQFIKETDILGVIGLKVQRNRVPENFHFPSIENKHRDVQLVETLYVDKDYLDVIGEYRKKNLNAIRPHNNAREQFKKTLQNYNWVEDKHRLKPIKDIVQNVPNIGTYNQLNISDVKKSLQRCQLLKKVFSEQQNYAMCQQIKNIRNQTQEYVQKYINDPQKYVDLFQKIQNNINKIQKMK